MDVPPPDPQGIGRSKVADHPLDATARRGTIRSPEQATAAVWPAEARQAVITRAWRVRVDAKVAQNRMQRLRTVPGTRLEGHTLRLDRRLERDRPR